MKILFFSRLFYPHIGGVETHVLEVSKRLVRKSHEVVVVTEELKAPRFVKTSRGKQNLKLNGIKILKIPVGKSERLKKFRIWWWLWRHRYLIREADIVHCHDVFFWYLPFRFFYFKKPVFTTFHGYETKFPPAKKAIFIRRLSEKLSWGNICIGQYLQKWYGTKADFVTYGGVNKVKSLKLKVQSDGVKVKILFIGRLEEDTGIKIYLEALEILRSEGISYGFEALGDGLLRTQVEKYGKVHGFVRDLSPHLARPGLARLNIVFSSSYLSILEAMSREKLVFSAYNNSLKEDYLKMAPFAKFIMIENSAEKLAEAVKRCQNQPENYVKKINAAALWARNESWEKVVKVYLELYNNKYHSL